MSCGLALLEKSSQSLAVKGITRFQFPDGELRLGHRTSPTAFSTYETAGRRKEHQALGRGSTPPHACSRQAHPRDALADAIPLVRDTDVAPRSGFTKPGDAINLNLRSLRQRSNLDTGTSRANASSEHLRINGIHSLKIRQINQIHRAANHLA